MTWSEFTEAISLSKIAGNDRKEKILIDLFDSAGSIKAVSEAAAIKWISGERKCKTISYFPDSVHTSGVYKHFRNRSETLLKDLQKAFLKVCPESFVETGTYDMHVFCWSLLNQFLVLLGMPWLEEPIGNMRKRFCGAVEEHNLGESFRESLNESPDGDLTGRIEEFLNTIDANIIEPFTGDYSDNALHQQIKEFHSELEGYLESISLKKLSMFSKYATLDNEVRHHIRMIDVLYSEISGDKTDSNIRLSAFTDLKI